jgi:hypothetical protein
MLNYRTSTQKVFLSMFFSKKSVEGGSINQKTPYGVQSLRLTPERLMGTRINNKTHFTSKLYLCKRLNWVFAFIYVYSRTALSLGHNHKKKKKFFFNRLFLQNAFLTSKRNFVRS